LDHNATTRPDSAVVVEMLSCLEESFGNPSSLHSFGQAARRVADRSRQRVADLIGSLAEEIVFTSGGTEASNQVLCGWLRPGRHVVVSGIEHQAVLNPCLALEAAGVRVTRVPADADGVVQPEAIAAAFTPETDLVSVMLVNNDTGVIQPVAGIVALARARGIPVHTDAVQAAGKLRIDVRALGVDFLSLSAHKFNGPKGVGTLYIRNGRDLPALLMGGTQENRRRAGTENLPGIAGFGMACKLAALRLPDYAARIGPLRDRLETGIRKLFPEAVVNGAGTPRIANTLLVSFPGVLAQALAMNLDLEGIAISTGSACSSASREPSHVLLAMGRTPEQALAAVRFSLGAENSETEIDRVLAALTFCVPRLRRKM
jgi:cysteine desulfurase